MSNADWPALCEAVAAKWPEARPRDLQPAKALPSGIPPFCVYDDGDDPVCDEHAQALWFRSLMEAAARRGYGIVVLSCDDGFHFHDPDLASSPAFTSRDSLTALARLCLAIAAKEPAHAS